ncbi:hypothetical protein [Bacillus amyloliquefaciens]|uniref:hypothetical protein n=1 Tax=Bacillus amyloliquefaciens TaxID=1390 RepID=UPI000D6AE59E|nr:hypothetical protein [Bacillus amyloliquefaciens]AWM47433.1 hypothetical protein DDT09_06070 [Bacillus amyloliquefaciens]
MIGKLTKTGLEEIRKRVERIIDEEWAWEYEDGCAVCLSGIERIALEVAEGGKYIEISEHDAEFIEEAPRNISGLLGHIEALEQEAEVLRTHLEKAEARLRIIARCAEQGSDVYVRKSR